eukprot:CAMPEP_0196668074 /NCGR_PEP_ID=MMETSP1086-20130531/65428_1 /TAXON_ID=77921 /ORGANISM="Cyanoptyche  gloeocystis , Strain SAG4.97" /LENGTH=233 /DNA_ID=CAMNT_0042005459 /DNA_START=92 /DNA_END=793 /DNA_ORIENTATION=+
MDSYSNNGLSEAVSRERETMRDSVSQNGLRDTEAGISMRDVPNIERNGRSSVSSISSISISDRVRSEGMIRAVLDRFPDFHEEELVIVDANGERSLHDAFLISSDRTQAFLYVQARRPTINLPAFRRLEDAVDMFDDPACHPYGFESVSAVQGILGAEIFPEQLKKQAFNLGFWIVTSSLDSGYVLEHGSNAAAAPVDSDEVRPHSTPSPLDFEAQLSAALLGRGSHPPLHLP